MINERESFEALPEIKQFIDKLIYGEKSEVYIAKEKNEADDAIATWVNGAWFGYKAKAQAVQEWISVEDEQPKGKCLVFLESNLCGNYIHSANFTEDYSIVGSVFAWDAPKVERWMPLLDGPSESGDGG